MLVKQINNLRIHRNKLVYWPPRPQYYVKAPDGRLLEEFNSLAAASKWCKNTPDFVQRKPAKQAKGKR